MLILFFKIENYVGSKLVPSIGDISLILETLLLLGCINCVALKWQVVGLEVGFRWRLALEMHLEELQRFPFFGPSSYCVRDSFCLPIRDKLVGQERKCQIPLQRDVPWFESECTFIFFLYFLNTILSLQLTITF